MVSDEIGAVATLGSTTGDSRVKYQPTPVVAVGFVVVSIAWSAQRSHDSHDLLGFRRPTVVALLTTERRTCSSIISDRARVVPSTLLGVHRGTDTV